MSTVANNGISIERSSLSTSLVDRYSTWNSPESMRGKAAPGVNFMSDNYVKGFTPNMQLGASDIRNIGKGGSGASFLYGNENKIPREVSDVIT